MKPQLTGEHLKRWRKSHRISQAKLAAQIGVTQGHICRMETGSKPIMPRTEMQLRMLFPDIEEWLETVSK